MLSRFSGVARCACRASSRFGIWEQDTALAASVAETCDNLQQTSASGRSRQECFVHSSPAVLANPDNKEPPSGRDRHDPTNVKYDTPTKDPDDTSDYAPGYYDEKGKGGHRRVASQEDSKQVPDQKVGGMPEDWHPEDKDDPTLPKPKDPHAPDIPQMDVHETPETTRSDSAADPMDPNASPPVGRSTQVSEGSMPDRESQQAGMPAAMAPPEDFDAAAPPEQKANPYDEESPFGSADQPDEMPTPATDKLRQGAVKPGKPPRPGVEDLNQNT